jgi:hypothetical protein
VDQDLRLVELERENAALRHAVVLLHEVSNLLHGSLEVEAACYAVLTGVTAGVGLGFNRAMLFETTVAPIAPCSSAPWPSGLQTKSKPIGSGAPSKRGQDDVPRCINLASRARRACSARSSGARAAAEARRRLLLSTALREGRLVHDDEAEDELDGLLDLWRPASPLRSRACQRHRGRAVRRQPLHRPALRTELEQCLRIVADHAGRAVENARRFEREAQRCPHRRAHRTRSPRRADGAPGA